MGTNGDYRVEPSAQAVEALRQHFQRRQEVASAAFATVTRQVRSSGVIDRLRDSYPPHTTDGDIANPVLFSELRRDVEREMAAVEISVANRKLEGEPIDLSPDNREVLISRLGHEYGRFGVVSVVRRELRNFSFMAKSGFEPEAGELVTRPYLQKFRAQYGKTGERIAAECRALQPLFETGDDLVSTTGFAAAFDEAARARLESIEEALIKLDASTTQATRGAIRRAGTVRNELQSGIPEIEGQEAWSYHGKRTNLSAVARAIRKWDNATERLATIQEAEVVIIDAWAEFLQNPASESLRAEFGQPGSNPIETYLAELSEVAAGAEVARVFGSPTVGQPPQEIGR